MLVDLVGLRGAAAYAALADLEHTAALAPLAPALADRTALAREVSRRTRLLDAALAALGDGAEASAAMQPAAAAVDDALARLDSGEWWEGLVTAALCGPLTQQLFARLTDTARSGTGQGGAPEAVAMDAAVTDATGSRETSDAADAWLHSRLSEAIEADEVLKARLALWGRRLIGELVVLAARYGGDAYPDLANQLTEEHRARMRALGLGR